MAKDEPSEEELRAAIATLEAVVADRAVLTKLEEPERRRLTEAAGRVSLPDRPSQRKLAKAFRRKAKEERRRADEAVLHETKIRTLRRALVYPTPGLLTSGEPPAEEAAPGTLEEARKCYVCKREFREVHHFYDQMCAECAELNWEKRHPRGDLAGRTALVTGARVKIGYQCAMFLLRAGARVIVLTRFPRDAAARYAREADFGEWRERLAVYGCDLRHTPSVEALARHLVATEQRLDFLINNACQTVRRPPGFYGHLLAAESTPLPALPEPERTLLAGHDALVAAARHGRHGPAGVADAPALTQIPLLDEDLAGGALLFPPGVLDQDLQQVDLRKVNSWRLPLADVPTVELLEVQLVNAVAPFVLTSKLRPLMLRVPSRDKHVVQVSAMEGQFYRAFKTDKHPHTNMAKAALNMLVRTSAADLVKDGIHMNAVDTGWVTDEDPQEIAARKTREHGFHPPLDVVDGAARVVDPIFDGLAKGEHAWGLFLKDYRAVPW